MLTTPQYHRLLEQVLKEAQRKTNTLLKSLPKDFKERLAAVPKVTIRFEERHAREKTDRRARVEPLSVFRAFRSSGISARLASRVWIDRRWSGRWGSNPRRSAWEADILPLNYSRTQDHMGMNLFRRRGSVQS
jgi:hypothetical protein